MGESRLSFWLVLGGSVAVLLVIVAVVSRIFRVLREIKTKARERTQGVDGDE
jgi:hypothetical protein